MRHLIIALVCLLAGCGGGTDDDADPQGQSSKSKKTPVRPKAGKALVNLDNGSDQSWSLQLDGKPRLTIPPHTIIGLQLDTGPHVFRIIHQGTDVDRIEATLESGKLTVINPRRLNSYRLMTVTYATGAAMWGAGGAGPRTRELGNAKLIQLKTYYDLLHILPSTIQMRVARFGNASETRSKIYKVPSKELEQDEALAIVAGQPEAYRARDRKRAIIQLGKLPADARISAALIDCVDDGRLVREAFAALTRRYAAKVPQQRIISWLGGKQAKGAVGLLLARKQGELLVRHASRVPDKQLSGVLSSLRKAPAKLRQQMVLACLDRDWPGKDGSLSGMIRARDFPLDLPFVKKLEAYIGGLTKPRNRSYWRSSWDNKLCSSAAQLPREWILPRMIKLLAARLAQSSKKRSGGVFLAIDALIALGAANELAPLLPKLAMQDRRTLFRRLSSRIFQNKQATPSELELALLGLADSEPPLRLQAFELLTRYGLGTLAVRRRLEAALRDERDASTRSRMDRAITQAMQQKLRDAKPKVLLEMALGGPSAGLVSYALARLFRDYKQREAHLVELARRYQSIARPHNRRWLMLGLKRFSRVKGFAKLIDHGLRDKDGAVRGAAVSGMLATIYKEGAASRNLLATIRRERDPARRKQMMISYNLWLIKTLKRRRGRSTREATHRQLIQLAADPDPQISLAALGGLSYLRVGDVGLLPDLARLFEAAPSDKHKQRILMNIQQIKDEKILPLLQRGLRDKSIAVRYQAFNVLYNALRTRRLPDRLRGLLEAARDREPDAKYKKRMTRSLSRLR